jgi:hypothetical protein
MFTIISVGVALAAMALAPKYGAESRPGFDERHHVA